MPRCYVRCRWGRHNLVSRSCLTSPCCSTGGVVFRWVGVGFDGIRPCCGGILPRPCHCGILPRLRRYPALPLSLHTRRGLVAVSFFTAAVSCLALVIAVSFFACGGILPRPYLCTPGVFLLRYPSSLQRYPASSLLLRYPSSLVTVSCLALISACPVWSCYGILLRCGGILPRPCLLSVLTGVWLQCRFTGVER